MLENLIELVLPPIIAATELIGIFVVTVAVLKAFFHYLVTLLGIRGKRYAVKFELANGMATGAGIQNGGGDPEDRPGAQLSGAAGAGGDHPAARIAQLYDPRGDEERAGGDGDAAGDLKGLKAVRKTEGAPGHRAAENRFFARLREQSSDA